MKIFNNLSEYAIKSFKKLEAAGERLYSNNVRHFSPNGTIPRPGTEAAKIWASAHPYLPTLGNIPRPGTKEAEIYMAAHSYVPIYGDMPRPGTKNHAIYMSKFYPDSL